jgi:hypothetical protein
MAEQTAYKDIDSAYENAKDTINLIASQKAWSSTQLATALADAEKAYDANASVWDTASSYVSAWGLGEMLGEVSEQAGIEQAQKFWADLYQRANAGWTSYPNGAKTIDWLRSASGAASTELQIAKESTTVAIVTEATAQTAADYGELATTLAETATDKRVWYGVAAAAAIAGALYLKVVFRL